MENTGEKLFFAGRELFLREETLFPLQYAIHLITGPQYHIVSRLFLSAASECYKTVSDIACVW